AFECWIIFFCNNSHSYFATIIEESNGISFFHCVEIAFVESSFNCLETLSNKREPRFAKMLSKMHGCMNYTKKEFNLYTHFIDECCQFKWLRIKHYETFAW